jgi:hypothetical protein
MKQRRNTLPGSVYFIRPVGAEGPVKIGCSSYPDVRLLTFENWSPVPLEIAAQTEGNFTLEKRFHNHFKHLHERGEWFRADPELSAAIEQINDGTFDVATLPEPKRVDGVCRRRKRAPEFYRLSEYV